MKPTYLMFAAALLTSTPALADVAGKWSGEVPALTNQQGRLEGPQQIILDLRADANGKATIGKNPTTDITQGNVQGKYIAFLMTLGPDFPVSRWAGEVNGDTLMLVRYPDGTATLTFSLKRAK